MTEAPVEEVELAEPEEPEIVGVSTVFGVPHGLEEEGTIVGSTTPPGSALNLEADEQAPDPTPPVTESIPVEVALVAAQSAPPETPWTKVAEEAQTLLHDVEEHLKGESSSGT